MKLRLALVAISCLSLNFAFSQEEVKALPERVQTLVDSYEREKKRVLNPVERKFDAALQDLKAQFTKAGRLEEAVATDKIIAARAEAKTEAERVEPKTTKWKWGSGGTLTLEAGGKAMHSSWTEPGTWEDQPGGTVKLTSQYNVSTITFQEDGTGIVKSNDRGGRGTTLKQID